MTTFRFNTKAKHLELLFDNYFSMHWLKKLGK